MKRVYRRSKWFYLRWGIFISLITAGIVAFFILRELDSVIHQKVQANFADRFPAATISISGARLEKRKGILLNHFRLSAKTPAVPAPEEGGSGHDTDDTRFPPVLEAEQVLLSCPTDIQELAGGELPIHEITFDSAIVRTFRRPDGTWSLTALKTAPSEKPSRHPPAKIHFRNTTIELLDMMDTARQRKLVARNVDLTVEQPIQPPAESRRGRYFPFHGTAECTFCKTVSFSGYFYPEEGMVRVEANIDSLQYSEAFRNAIPLEVAEKMAPLKNLRGEMTGKLTVIAPLNDFSRARFLVEGTMKDGRVEEPSLPQAVTNIHTDFRVANDGYMLTNTSANYGEGRIVSSTAQHGFHPAAKRRIQARISRLDLTEGLSAALPAGIQKILRDLKPTGRVDVDAGFIFDGANWSVTGTIIGNDLSVSYVNFPYRVDKLDGKIEMKGDQVFFDFKTPDHAIQVSGDVFLGKNLLFSQDSPQAFRESPRADAPSGISGNVYVRAVALPIEERLIAACPLNVTELIRSLELTGAVNVFTEHQFFVPGNSPLPEGGPSGQGGQDLLRGQNHPVGYAVTLPEEGNFSLAAGYSPAVGNVFSQAAPAPADSQVKTDHRITLQLLNCSCRYQNFPYPLRNIQGTISIHNNQFVAHDLRGDNNNATVVLSCKSLTRAPSAQTAAAPAYTGVPAAHTGRNVTLAGYDPRPEFSSFPIKKLENLPPAGEHSAEARRRAESAVMPENLALKVTAANVTLDEEFYRNLPQSVGSLFHYIQPQGTVNIQYAYYLEAGRTRMEVAVDIPDSGISVTLPAFSTRLEDFQGKFRFSDGMVTLTDFKARHGTSRVSGNMHGKMNSENEWECHFEDLCVDGIRFDRDFLTIIPAEMRGALTSIRPGGLLYYRGTLDVLYRQFRKRPFLLEWKGEAGITQGSVSVGIQLTNINGGVNVEGTWDGTDLSLGGEINLESLFFQKIQFTQVRGPIWIDNRQMLFGGDASRKIYLKRNPKADSVAHVAQESISAKAISGEAYGNFAVFFADPSTFHFSAAMTKGRLEECSHLTGSEKLKGNILASVDLRGKMNSLHTLKGNGEIHLTDADIYELSTMMALLKILSLKEVNRKGFSSGDLRYRIDGNVIYLDRIEFQGDAFSLIGKGEMDFNQKVRLIFYTVVGRGGVNIPILKDILHSAGKQTMLLTMEGPLQNPTISQHPFPGLNMAIQQIEKELLPSTPVNTIPNSSTPGWRQR